MDKTFCIFGDSVTQAAYVKDGWVNLLKMHLESTYSNGFVNVFNLGIGGDTTAGLLNRLEIEASSRYPSSIIIAIGINDTKDTSSEQFKINVAKLIEMANQFTTDITFIGLVLGELRGDEPYDQDKTTQFNEIIKNVAEQKTCKYISLQNVLNSDDFFDGLHPNEIGHQKMFEVIKEYFK